MVTGLIGRKIGMTQLFDEEGKFVPVTVIEAGPCPVLQIKTKDQDGYEALQLGFGVRRVKTSNRPDMGRIKKVGLEKPVRFVKEVAYTGDPGVAAGQNVTASIFAVGERVKVTGTNKGRGFAGTIKKYNFTRGPSSHGSKNVREIGSTGTNTSPGRVKKGQRMPGQYGNKKKTVGGLRIVRIDEAKNQILIEGAVPGPNGGFVMLRKGY